MYAPYLTGRILSWLFISVSLILTACGGGGGSDQTPTNTAPQITSVSTVGIPENSTAVMTVTATDADGDSISYSLPNIGDNSLFTIDTITGELAFISAPNFEVPTDAGADNTYDISVIVSDSNDSTTGTITLTVIDVNETPVFTSNNSTDIAENTTSVMTVAASDPEGSNVSYSLSGTTDDALFNITPATGALSFVNAPNFEVPGDIGGDNTYNVTVTASDGSNSVNQAVTITVTNINELPTFTSATSTSVAENSTTVMSITATDVEGSVLAYSLSGSVDDGLFNIDPISGVLAFSVTPDFEMPGDVGSDNVYNITVSVSDGTNSVAQGFMVTVTNVDEAPAFTTLATAQIAENSIGPIIISANDPENATLSYSLSGSVDDALFSINASSGVVNFISAPDFEAPGDVGNDNVYNITVSVSDGGNAISQVIAVTVTDVDEAPAFTSANTATITENTTGAITVLAVDPENATISYSLTGSVDDALFSIDTNSGAVNFTSAPDFEAPGDVGGDNVYNITVSASDGSNTIAQGIAITVTNVDEAPAFTSADTATIAENSIGPIIISANDPENATLSYSLTGSVDDALFTIDANSGSVNFIIAPDFEVPGDVGSDNVYNITVSASDGTNTATQNLAITVTDVLELSVSSGGIKTLAFSWTPYAGASYYKLLVNADGVSGYSQEGTNIVGTNSDVYIPVHLTNWINTSYMLEAYDGSNTLLNSSPAISVTNLMLSSIGYIKASNTGANDNFGYSSVALSGDGSTLAVGAFLEDSSTTGINSASDDLAIDSGAVYTFRRDTNTGIWNLQAYIKASNTGANDQFGKSVALSHDGNTLAVGAAQESSSTSGINTLPNELASVSGAAYIFRYDAVAASWSEQAYIKASNTAVGARFGNSVALNGDGNTLAVGAFFGADACGAAYLFRYDTIMGTWSEQAHIKASNPGGADYFGTPVVLSSDGNTLAVGATGESSNTTGINSTPNDLAVRSGAVYMYRFNTTTNIWFEQAYIKASNSDTNDNFGNSVALSNDGNTLVVGAPLEDSSSFGVNSTPDESALDSGAVYLFRFDIVTSTWSQQAYIKAQTMAGNHFGQSVALSSDGNTLLAGAVGEDSPTVGINPPSGQGASNSGAAYLLKFDTTISTWLQKAYVKASNTGAGDGLGVSTAISNDGNTLAIGAYGESSSTTGINSVPDELAPAAGAVYLY